MKTAVVTGASYGIGAAVAEAFVREGWKVYCLSRTKPQNKQVVWLECDLSQPEQLTSCLRAVSEPTIDAFISNAGVIVAEPATEVTAESYRFTYSVNVLAPMLLVAALQDKIRRATIISVSSVSDRIPDAGVALYSSSKAANTLYFNTLAAELPDAKVYTLLPDYVDTPMQHKSNDNNKDFDWAACLTMDDVARFTLELVRGEHKDVESGANIIMVTNALKDDLKSVEKLYGYNTDTKRLAKL